MFCPRYEDFIELSYMNPLLHVELAKRFTYIPSKPEPAIVPGIMSVKGVTDTDTLQPYINPVVFDFLAIKVLAERMDSMIFAEELLQTMIHEIVHASRDGSGYDEIGTWFMGIPLGDEAETEAETRKIVNALLGDEEFRSTLKNMAYKLMNETATYNLKEIIELAVLVDRLKHIYPETWIHEKDLNVISVDDTSVKLEFAIVTRVQAIEEVFKGLEHVKYTGESSDRIYVEAQLTLPSLDEYEYLSEEE